MTTYDKLVYASSRWAMAKAMGDDVAVARWYEQVKDLTKQYEAERAAA